MAQYALSNPAASTTNGALVAAPSATQRIRVYAVFVLTAGTATNVTFNTKPAGSNTAISALMACGANGGFVLPYNPKGWFQTNPGDALTVTTGSGSTTGVQVVYEIVPV